MNCKQYTKQKVSVSISAQHTYL